jgi:hypothetical protein
MPRSRAIKEKKMNQRPRIQIPGVDTSRALDLTPKGSGMVVSDNPESIYRRKKYTLEVRYNYISGLHVAILLLKTASEGVPKEICPSCRTAYEATASADLQILQERLNVLIVHFNELIKAEEDDKGAGVKLDIEERRAIGLELAYTVKKMIEIRGVAKDSEVEVVDKFHESTEGK